MYREDVALLVADDAALMTAFGRVILVAIVFWWLSSAIAVGFIAMERKRPFLNWFAAGLLFSPLIAVLLLIAAGDGDELRDEQRALLRKIAAATKPTKIKFSENRISEGPSLSESHAKKWTDR